MQVPGVTLEDLQVFQAAHFPGPHKPLIPPTTEPAQEEKNSYEAEEDLGYYPDGMKRTLTDEQIRIFRHSEIHALLRARQLEEDDAEYEARRHVADDAGAENSLECNAKAADASLSNDGSTRRRSSGGRKPNTQRPHNASSDLDYGESTQDTTKSKPEKNVAYIGRKIVSYAD
ncbi:hypothetical protein N7448_004222 [Penicillium atrosanguineum]|uniref:Uncharacterized protein n=1 Tax=Penicillium atrosanguineum TaxID=1132637 RepID=A0A9W9U5I9_9EURO|nr:uncharacterized protein N7443_003187 [Penicillium atrosanguineum]KAJ5117285.1 hypothetical protein N7526_011394 [Penicillium atrosanguineum]KAJ5140814.1 hypothetical protein N7448_004222 [Penicillium atrosanguineum]KAJ5310726.1 hypothetical protein N7443_003187 [Penicillium atrosanguineum]KAJ5316249.1 hypothetical protein N7476_006556 [Penicillium atrosanguineum]